MLNLFLRLTCFVATLGRGPPARPCDEIATADADAPSHCSRQSPYSGNGTSLGAMNRRGGVQDESVAPRRDSTGEGVGRW